MRSRAVLVHFGSVTSSSAVQFGVSLLAARLLAPQELGTFGIAAALAAVAHALRDLGVSAYLQRERELGPTQVSSALGLAFASGLGLALLLPMVAAGLGAWLGTPGVAPLADVLSLGLLAVPIGAVGSALALRIDDAGKLARVTAWGSLANATGTLALLAAGLGASALAWAQVINLAACSVVHWLERPRELWGAPRCAGWRPILRTGRGTVATSLLNSLVQASPAWLLARWAGAVQAGLLGRAQSIVGLLPGLAGMAMQFGAVGRLARAHHGKTALAPQLQRSAAVLTRLTWPLLALSAVLAEPLVLLLFGPSWRAAAPAIPALALLTALAMAFNDLPAALTAVGRPALAGLPQLLTLLWRCGLLAGASELSSPVVAHALAAVFAWLLLGAGLLALPLQLWLAQRFLGLSPAAFGRALAPSALAAAATAAAAQAGRLALAEDTSPGMSILAGAAGALPVAAAAALCDGWWRRPAPPHRPQRGSMSWRRRITIRK